MKKTVSVTLLIVLTLFLSGCAGAEERAWQAGQKALAQEKYADAVTAFTKAGTFQDSSNLLLYSSAWSALENGDYENAGNIFQSLGDFKDSNLMVSYCTAREQEAYAKAGYSSGDNVQAVKASKEAFTQYAALAFFRDSDIRASSCRDQIYAKSTDWMNLSQFEDAASGFAVLGSWQDSDRLHIYCKAASFEQQGSYLEAAEQFSSIAALMDSDARAAAAWEHAYQDALSLKNSGSYESAVSAFAALNGYEDSEKQKDECTALLVTTLLQSGSYSEALQKYYHLVDRTVFPAADQSETGNLDAFLDSFINSWMTAHSRVMNAFFSCNLLQPYLLPGGELDTKLQAEITDDDTPLNYGFIYYGKELKELRVLDSKFEVAQTHSTASYIAPEGLTEVEETLLILIDISSGNPVAAAVLSE